MPVTPAAFDEAGDTATNTGFSQKLDDAPAPCLAPVVGPASLVVVLRSVLALLGEKAW
ncbi:hypothetical protein [Streptomyces sp. NPDC003522]